MMPTPTIEQCWRCRGKLVFTTDRLIGTVSASCPACEAEIAALKAEIQRLRPRPVSPLVRRCACGATIPKPARGRWAERCASCRVEAQRKAARDYYRNGKHRAAG